MYKAYLFLVGIFLSGFTNALFDETSTIKKVTNAIDLLDTFMNVEFLTAVLFYRNDNRSKSMEPIFSEFANTKKNFYRFFAVDCDSIEQDINKEVTPACSEDFKEALPQILFLEPQEDRSKVQTNKTLEPIQHRFEGEPNLEDFNDFAKKIMPSYSKRLVNVNDLDMFLADRPRLKKAIFLTDKKSVPQYWKALSSNFKDRLLFGEALSKGYQIHEKYGIQKFPAVIVLNTKPDGTIKEIPYEGEPDYKKLEAFFNKYASEKKIIQKKNPNPLADSQSKDPKERLTPKNVPKPVIRDLIPEKFEEIVYGTEGLVLIHAFKDRDTHASFDDIIVKFNNIVDIYNLKCNEAGVLKFAEQKLKIKSFPSYRLYPIGSKEKKNKSKIIYTKIKNFMEISKDVSDIIGDPLVPLSDEEINSYLENVASTSKPAVILFHNQDQISMSLRVFAQLKLYKERINFASYKNPSKEVKEKFGFEQLPRLFVIFAKDPNRKGVEDIENIQTAVYTGRYEYNELKEFLDMFLPAEIRTLTLSKTISQVDKPEDFSLVCQNKNMPCVIGLIDGYSADYWAMTRVKNELAVLERVKSNFTQSPLTFLWIDAACHSEILNSLDITIEFPAIVYYIPLSKVLIQLPKVFDSENITTFLEGCVKGSTQFVKNLQEIPQLETKNCQAFHLARDPAILKKLSPKPPTSKPSSEKISQDKPSKNKPSVKDEL